MYVILHRLQYCVIAHLRYGDKCHHPLESSFENSFRYSCTKEVKGDKVTFLAQMRLEIKSVEAGKEFHRQGIKGAKKTKSSSDQNKVDLRQLKNEHLYFFCFQS